MKQEYQDLIDQYLLRQIPEEERQAFEREIDEDAEMKEQLEFTEIVREAIVGRNRRLAQIKEWEKNYEIERWKRQDRNVSHGSPPRGFRDGDLLLEEKCGSSGNCLSKGCILSIVTVLVLLIIGYMLLFNYKMRI